MSQKSSEGVARAATAMPVIEGALALIVISFVGMVWPHVPSGREHDAMVVVYASGAHFMFAFVYAVPAMLIAANTRSLGLHIGLVCGLFSYVFWSLNEQHRALANLLLPEPWQLPLPLCEAISAFTRLILGQGEIALYLSPLVLATLVATVLGVPLMLLVRGKN